MMITREEVEASEPGRRVRVTDDLVPDDGGHTIHRLYSETERDDVGHDGVWLNYGNGSVSGYDLGWLSWVDELVPAAPEPAPVAPEEDTPVTAAPEKDDANQTRLDAFYEDLCAFAVVYKAALKGNHADE